MIRIPSREWLRHLMQRAAVLTLLGTASVACGGPRENAAGKNAAVDSATSSSRATANVASARIAVPRTSQPDGWPMPGGDYSNSRYAELDDITAENVKSLQVAWALSTGVLRGH